MKNLFFLPIVILLASGGCSHDSLEGSIGDRLSLDFDYLQIRKQQLFLIIEYIKESNRGVEKICKLTVDTQGLELPDGGSLDLEDDVFLSHIELQRTTFENDSFPQVKDGYIHFSHIDFRDNGKAEGKFLCIFVDSLTLRGEFTGNIEEI